MTSRPGLWLTVGTVLLAVLCIPAFGIGQRVDLPAADAMPADSQVRQASEIGAKSYGAGVLSPVEIVVHSTPDTVEHDARRVADVLRDDPEVRSVNLLPLQRQDAYRVSVATSTRSRARPHRGARVEPAGRKAARIPVRRPVRGGRGVRDEAGRQGGAVREPAADARRAAGAGAGAVHDGDAFDHPAPQGHRAGRDLARRERRRSAAAVDHRVRGTADRLVAATGPAPDRAGHDRGARRGAVHRLRGHPHLTHRRGVPGDRGTTPTRSSTVSRTPAG